ncbi:MAG: citrate synthase [Anaerovoracaceae bacterium]|nr:citrate synthase [Anaerovoracaceae bacterium]
MAENKHYMTSDRDIHESSYFSKMANSIQQEDIIDESLYKKYNVKRGLRNANGTGVLVGLTRIGDVHGYDKGPDGEKIPVRGELRYRGYEVQDLVGHYIKEERFGFEEITYLLMFGELPTAEQLAEFEKMIGERRELPEGFSRNMIMTAPSSSVMNKIMRSVLALYSYDDDPDSIEPENVIRQEMNIIGYFPSIIAYSYQAKQMFFNNESMYLHPPVAELGTAENVLRMLRPTGDFDPFEARVLDLTLILQAEHGGGNNSAFTTYLLSSSATDTYSVLAAAIGSLKGPRHGGANIKVIEMIEDLKKNVHDITNRQEVDRYLMKVLNKEANDRSGLIYGIGHAVYTLSDPRAEILKSMAQRLAVMNNKEDDYQLCEYIAERGPELFRQHTGIDQPMCANVDLYSGLVYEALNIPKEMCTPLFALARLSGWCAHRLEEIITGRKLIRPSYRGVQPPRDYVPLDRRTGERPKRELANSNINKPAKR